MPGNGDQAQGQVQGFTMEQITTAINAAVEAAASTAVTTEDDREGRHKSEG